MVSNNNQQHYLQTMLGPDSSYYALVIQIAQKVERDERIDPPIHAENFLSGGATTLILMVEGASAVTSLLNLSGIPGNMVVAIRKNFEINNKKNLTATCNPSEGTSANEIDHPCSPFIER